ncbi:MAG: ATP-binding protein [Bacillota bacterium]
MNLNRSGGVILQKKLIEQRIERRNFKRGGEVSSKLKSVLRKLGVDNNIIRRTSIITYELEMNIIIHSLGGKIKTIISSEYITILAEDDGPGIEDVDKALEAGYSTAEDEIRELGFGAGMGLNNIEKYSDEMDIESSSEKGTKVVAKLKV